MTAPDTNIQQYDAGSGKSMQFLIKQQADGTYTEVVSLEANSVIGLVADLRIGAKSLALTLSTGAGSVPIPDTGTVIGVKPVSSNTIRVGLEVPEANGTATGNAVSGDLKKGFPVDAGVWTWFQIGIGSNRTLYVTGGASDVLEIVVS